MKLFLLRHAKDIEGYRGGWSQIGLSEEGLMQAEMIANYISSVKNELNIKRIISSDLRRAVQTALPICEKLKLNIELSEKWRETNNGNLAGLENDLANKLYPGLYFSSLEMDQRYPGGESPQENFERINQSFKDLLAELNPMEGNVLLVTHGGVINILYHIVKGLHWTNKNTLLESENISLHCIDISFNKLEFTLENYHDYNN